MDGAMTSGGLSGAPPTPGCPHSEASSGAEPTTSQIDDWTFLQRDPAELLDVGCAEGALVHALHLRDDAHGFDFSGVVTQNAPSDIRERVRVGSAVERINGPYDLITYIEVLEYMDSADAWKAIDAMCTASDSILFTWRSAAGPDATERTVSATPEWAACFTDRGFYRSVLADGTSVAPSGMPFERATVGQAGRRRA